MDITAELERVREAVRGEFDCSKARLELIGELVADVSQVAHRCCDRGEMEAAGELQAVLEKAIVRMGRV